MTETGIQRALAAVTCGSVLLASFAIGPTTRATELLGPGGVTHPVGRSPRSLASVDLDGDGTLDLVTADYDGDSVSILSGDGDGGFTALETVEIGLGSEPISVTAADFNLDERVDLAVAASGDDPPSIRILLRNADGEFDEATRIDVSGFPAFVAAMDLDADGAADLVVADRTNGELLIHLGTGTGSFRAGEPVAVESLPVSIAAADLDADGDVDLAVANRGSANVSVALGDGSGRFPNVATYDVGRLPFSVTAGDFDADGNCDLAVANFNDDTVSVLLGRGTGVLDSTEEPVDVGPVEPGGPRHFPVFVEAVDLDSDGADDLVVAKRDSDSLSLLLADGQGGFARTGDLAVGDYPRAVAAGDFDRDGAADLAVAHRESDSVAVLPGDGLGALARRNRFAVPDRPRALVGADFDRDGATDLAVARFDAGKVRILRSDRLGGFVEIADPDVEEQPRALAAADFDGDGILDVAVANHGSDSVSLLRGLADGDFASSEKIDLEASPLAMVAGDWNADGRLDLAATGSFPDSLSLVLNRGSEGFEVLPLIAMPDGPNSIVTADFDDDGRADLATANTGAESVGISFGNDPSRIVEIPLGADAISLAAADLDRDGDTDLAVALSDLDSLRILRNDGGDFTAEAPIAVGDGPAAVVAGNLNADEWPDLVVANFFGDSATVLLGIGDARFVRALDVAAGLSPEALALGDFDGDGLTDLAAAGDVADTVSILGNQLDFRADLNGSNRVDGFDVSRIGRLFPAEMGPGSDYRRSVDVNLDGRIDGGDLALVGERFGEPNEVASPLRAALPDPSPPAAGSVTFVQVARGDELLRVSVRVEGDLAPIAGADFTALYPATDGDPAQVLEYEGFEPGDLFAGGPGHVAYNLKTTVPGEVGVSISRLPFRDQPATGAELIRLIFRPRREDGRALLGFDGFVLDEPGLLGETGPLDVSFVGGVPVTITAPEGTPPGQRLGFAPSIVEFAPTEPGLVARALLRISNFGFSDLNLSDVTLSRPDEFRSYLRSAVAVPAFGSIDLPLEFSTPRAGLFAADLWVASDEPRTPLARVPLVARSTTMLAASPLRLDFGSVPVGSAATRSIRVTNRSETMLAQTTVGSPDTRFEATASFADLEALGSGNVEVTFRPDAVADYDAFVTVEFGGPGGTIVVAAVRGSGE